MMAARRTPGRERHAAPRSGMTTPARSGPRRHRPSQVGTVPRRPHQPAPLIRTPVPASRHVRRSREVPPPGARRSGAGPRTGVLPGPARRLTPGSPVAVTSPAGGTAGPAAGGVRPSPQHRHRRMRTPGGARRGGLAATRSRAVPGRPAGPAPSRGPADHCGARARSGRPGPAAAARSAATRRPPVHLTRCTRRASSRRGTRRSCAPRPDGPATPPGWALIWTNQAIHSLRSATQRPTPPPPRPGPCWTMPRWPASGPARRAGRPARQDPAPARPSPGQVAHSTPRTRRRPARHGWPARPARHRPAG